jgi:type I restriction enzyme S subunit
MPENWITYKLGDISEIIMGQSPKGATTNNLGEGLPLLNGPTEFGYFHPTPTQFTIDPKKVSQIGDLLFCVRGSTTGRMNFSDQPYAIGRGIGSFRGKNGFSTKYIKYIIDFYLDRMLAICTGSTFPNLSRFDLENFDVKSCSPKESNAIASILSALDDKIELNLQMNKTLEEMAMALYKHWFVDFGPFQNEEFIDSELGEIPKGWKVRKLDDLINALSKGTTPRKKDVDGLLGEVSFLKVKDINNDGSINYSGIEEIPKIVHENQLKRSILKANDILFSIAGTIGRVSMVPEQLQNSNCNQALAFIRLADKELLPHVYYWLKSANTQREIHSSIVQGAQANVSLTVLKSLLLVVPDSNSQIKFNKEIEPLFHMVIANREENQTITQLRDTLLPKLISGEVRVKDVEKTLTEVL